MWGVLCLVVYGFGWCCLFWGGVVLVWFWDGCCGVGGWGWECNLTETKYNVFGYKAKQVRDNIHSYDVARFIAAFIESPRAGEVYNIGGGRQNSCSILEAFSRIEALSDKKMIYEYVDQNRSGDHICYISDLRKMRSHVPSWDISKSLDDFVGEIYSSWKDRAVAAIQ